MHVLTNSGSNFNLLLIIIMITYPITKLGGILVFQKDVRLAQIFYCEEQQSDLLKLHSNH